jgi:hypothetical protein
MGKHRGEKKKRLVNYQAKTSRAVNTFYVVAAVAVIIILLILLFSAK